MKIRKALAIMIICLAGINLTGYKFFISEDLNPIMEDYMQKSTVMNAEQPSA